MLFSHSMCSWDSWASSRAQVLRDFSTTCSLPTVHRTPNSRGNFASTCVMSWTSRHGRTMTSRLASRSTCPSVRRCVAVDAVCCLWRRPSSTARSSTSSWMTPWIASVVSALSSVCPFITSLSVVHDLTSSVTCTASSTILSTSGTNSSLLSKVSYTQSSTTQDDTIRTFLPPLKNWWFFCMETKTKTIWTPYSFCFCLHAKKSSVIMDSSKKRKRMRLKIR